LDGWCAEQRAEKSLIENPLTDRTRLPMAACANDHL